MRAVGEAFVGEDGLQGDHARPGKRAVTLFQHEHLAAISGFLGGRIVHPSELRRTVHVAGLNLSAMRGVALCLGEAMVEITVPCAPCSRMRETFGPGGYNALRGHGGWCAQVLRPGAIRIGDAVRRAGIGG